MPWSPLRERWIWERAAAPCEANKAHGLLEKQPYPRVLCGSKLHSHPRNFFNVVRTLCPPHTFYMLCMHGPTVPKHVPRLQLIQTCWFKGRWDAQVRDILQIRTPSLFIVTLTTQGGNLSHSDSFQATCCMPRNRDGRGCIWWTRGFGEQQPSF